MATTPTTPTTLLGAVNQLLKAIRVTGVMTLQPENLTEYGSNAKEALDSASIEVQTEGWYFNTEPNATLSPSTTGEVFLPNNLLAMNSARCSDGSRLVERGQRLYDPTKRTFNIGKAVQVDMILALPFEELPQVARAYITAVAARTFCVPNLPTGTTFRYTEDFLSKTRATLEQKQTEWLDETLKTVNPHVMNQRRR